MVEPGKKPVLWRAAQIGRQRDGMREIADDGPHVERGETRVPDAPGVLAERGSDTSMGT